ncbi:DUF418 domain-containing protein [Litchfieldia salsa]|uniref:DUF418 domain-containing protein n=2 Tax=Litchfieldia salsa TaxID=930152 RepID=A0A1H0UMQ7_9BACI|nr:uncharacterized protein SAMN05216565_10531 [Litchfieldia salsa]
MNMNGLQPISKSERIQGVDIIRGFAIFGIFLVNMPSFNSPMLHLQPESWWPSQIDQMTLQFIDLFAQANFYTLFSFLFGFGMVLFQKRVVIKGYSFSLLVTRRLLVLLIIGCIHAFFIWHGDILISYAIIGVIFLLFYKTKPLSLLVLSLLLIFVPSLLFFGLLMLSYLVDPTSLLQNYSARIAEETAKVYSSGSITEITLQRIQDWYYVNNLDNAIFLVFALLPMFLLGAYIAKKQWFSKIESHVKAVQRLLFIAVIIAIPIKLLPYYTEKNIATDFLQDSIGGPAAAMVYASSIMLLTRNKTWQKVLSPLSFVGRLSLSNYLFQSIVCTLLFYNYGLGLYGKVTPSLGLILTIFIYSVQVVISKWWLSHYQYGPVEWIWRSLTYGKRQVFRRRVLEKGRNN